MQNEFHLPAKLVKFTKMTLRATNSQVKIKSELSAKHTKSTFFNGTNYRGMFSREPNILLALKVMKVSHLWRKCNRTGTFLICYKKFTGLMLNVSDIRVSSLGNSEYVKPFQLHYVQNGVNKTWDLIKTHHSVGIIIYNASRKVLVCVKQFRPGVYVNSIPEEDRTITIDTKKYPPSLGITLEFCAGIIDKDKSLKEIAKEEVLEECGYAIPIESLELVQTFRCAVGVSGDKQTLFYAEVTDEMKKTEGGGLVEEGELLEVIEMSLKEADECLKSDNFIGPSEFLYGLLWFFGNKVSSFQ